MPNCLIHNIAFEQPCATVLFFKRVSMNFTAPLTPIGKQNQPALLSVSSIKYGTSIALRNIIAGI
jgi:hypothetical protein